ncbi:outer membrane lipoprotein LolB [Niveibacterium microcysteis]|uniref:Outer-membrane lipoprotein LolB n=1 Tax=Niveibacterium microcysteis TaxID=2811415 RepID=A0ABX7MAF9_9RHOO|nr:outer membrane lipoprotein LolB [Niveibacterium microcysteis]QSI77644.1 outer membrane lipoprotein LolB [Niveibacterium microcysteis]
MSFGRRIAAALGLVAAALLNACATAPQQAPLRAGDYSLSGRVLVRQASRADVLRLNWTHLGMRDTVRLETPLGQTVAELQLDPQRAHVQLGDGRAFEAADDVALAEQVIGVPLPLRQFSGWLRAEPGASAVAIERDSDARIVSMRDSGWLLSYSGYGAVESVAGPSLIEARQGDVVVRVKIESWLHGVVE